MNDESKPRRDSKADILAKGIGKVMSYKDLMANCAEKEAAKQAKRKGKWKRSRKRKNLAEAETRADADADAGEPALDTPELATKAKQGRKRKGDIPEGDGIEAERKAKVARMSEAPEPMALEAWMSEAQELRAREARMVASFIAGDPQFSSWRRLG